MNNADYLSEASNVTNSQVMDLQQLIAGPLTSTIEADAISSNRYLKILQMIAFEDIADSEGNVTGKKLRTLSFCYTETNAGGNRLRTVTIPLLTLVPLPLLQIHEADFDYDINILDAVSYQAGESFDFVKGHIGQSGNSSKAFRLRAALATTTGGGHGNFPDKGGSKLAANMKVHVKMRQADLPAGLGNILRLAASSLEVTDPALPHDNTEKQ